MRPVKLLSTAAIAASLVLSPAALAHGTKHANHTKHASHSRVHKNHRLSRRARLAITSRAGVKARTATVTAPVTGVTYYVSPNGSDTNSGTSQAQAWRTVSRVNHQVLHPGDAVLFQGGATFADTELIPSASGAAGRPIDYGSYGPGNAVLPQGVWFIQNWLLFNQLTFGNTFYGGSATRGTSNNIVLENSTVSLPRGNSSLGVFANGRGWVIANNRIQNTGLSGLLLWGGGYLVTGNTITNTGLDASAPYNSHGIYLDASNSTITANTITNFQASGISVRYRNAKIHGNVISGGQIGIDFFQTDPAAGTCHWTDNQITQTTAAGIYVSPAGVYATRESFVIENNAINPHSGLATNLKPTSGTYTVSGNGRS